MSAVEISDCVIKFRLDFFIHKDFSFSDRELIVDIISQNYNGQSVVFSAYDGENLKFSGFLDFVVYLKDSFTLKEVIIESHGLVSLPGIQHKMLAPGIFLSAGRAIVNDIDRDMKNAKLLGVTLGRFNPVRLRLAYELDHAFPNDNYMIFHASLGAIKHRYKNVLELYQKEMRWLEDKKFDQDLKSIFDNGMIDWETACENYTSIWNNYHIEVVSETDAHSSYWVTEKTARCLATGKPFVLMSGAGALDHLKSFGFKTYGDFIDEDYDKTTTPNQRIQHIIKSLKQLQHGDFPAIMQKLNEIAAENAEIYKVFSKKTFNV
jgi:hypothetical protein